MPVRVIRVLEYEYPDHETAELDMSRWGVPPNGTRRGWGKGWSVVRSATTFPAMADPMATEPTWRNSKKPPQEVLDVLQSAFNIPSGTKIPPEEMGRLAVINNWVNMVTGQGGAEELSGQTEGEFEEGQFK